MEKAKDKFSEVKIFGSFVDEFGSLISNGSRCYLSEAPDFVMAGDRAIGVELVAFSNGYDLFPEVEVFYRDLGKIVEDELNKRHALLDVTLAPVSFGDKGLQLLSSETSKVSRRHLRKELASFLVDHILDNKKGGLCEAQDLTDKLDSWFSWIQVRPKPKKWMYEKAKVEIAGMPSDIFCADALQQIVDEKQIKIPAYLEKVENTCGKPCDELWLLIHCSKTFFLSSRHDNNIPLCNSVLPGTPAVTLEGAQSFSRIFLGISSWGDTLRWHEIG